MPGGAVQPQVNPTPHQTCIIHEMNLPCSSMFHMSMSYATCLQ